MNLFQRQDFAKKSATGYNTYIGGVSATITTAALLAAKFKTYPANTAFDVADITNFTIVGDEIRCFIAVPYNNNLFDTTTSLTCTYYKDLDGWIRNAGSPRGYAVLHTYHCPGAISGANYGRNCPLLDLAYLPTTTSIPDSMFYGFMENKKQKTKAIIYIPLATTLVTPSTGWIFSGGAVNANTTIYCHPSLATNNGGAPDNDIATAIAAGATIRYVVNLTAPAAITDLSVGTVLASAIQLNFTAPSSTNAIDYYEIWIDGVRSRKTITASGQYVMGLVASTTYSIEVKPVDIYYNVSSSNPITQLTGSTYDVAAGNIVSSYQLEGNANDSVGANHGTATAMTYESGLVGQRGVFNGTTSKVSCTNNANLQLSTVSVCCIVKTNAANSGDKGVFNKIYSYGFFVQSNIVMSYSSAAPVGYKTTGFNIGDNIDHVVLMTMQSGVTDGTKIYIDGILILTTTITNLNQTGSLHIGAFAASAYFSGKIDEATVWNSILTPLQVSDVTAKLLAGLHLT